MTAIWIRVPLACVSAFWFAAGWAGVTGCAGGGAATASPAAGDSTDRVALDGAAIRASDDPLVGLSTYDAALLFHLAGEAERNDRRELARRIYTKLIDEFPDGSLAPLARFNLGLLLERDAEFAAAAQQYEPLVVGELPDADEARRLWIDAHYRLGVCYGRAGAWDRAAAIFDRVLAVESLTVLDRLEALVGKGIAMQESGDLIGAEVTFNAALRFHRDAAERERVEDHGLAAEAAFRLGELARDRFDAVILEFPQARLTERLEKKCEELLSAQSRFLRAIQLGDAHTVAAAGYRIGSLYERLYDTIMALEAPAELTPEQIEVYQEEVRDRVAVLVRKAIQVYEKALVIGRRAPTAADWVARLEGSLERLKTVFLAE